GGMQIDFNKTATQKDFSRADDLSGNAFASFLLGAPSGGTIDNNVRAGYRWTFVAPWVQDDWRVTPKLTLNLGFRWDFNSPVSEAGDQLNYIFDPTLVNPVSAKVGQQVLGGLTFVDKDGKPSTPYQYDKNNYQVRGGMAYQLNEKTVLRAGYGKYFLNPTGEGQTQGFSLATSLIASQDGGRTPTYALGNPFPTGIQQPPGSSLGPLTFLGRGVTFLNPDFVTPNVHQFSVGVQRELPWNVSLEVTYAGSGSYEIQGTWAEHNDP